MLPTKSESVGRLVDIAKLVARCVQLGEEAGERMREVQARPSLDTVDKGGEYDAKGEYIADVQTAADREVEELCVSSLMSEFPGVHIVAEEAVALSMQRSAKEAPLAPLTSSPARAALAAPWPRELRSLEAKRIVVYIDPLDGTGEFVNGNLEPVTNLLGIAVDGVPVAGVINQPWALGVPAGRTIWGGPRIGVHGANTTTEAQPGSICTNRVVRSNRCAGALKALGVKSTTEVQRVSATGFNFLSVLEGRYELFALTRHGTKKWDSCAGEALLVAAGGLVTDAVGRHYLYTSDPNTHHNLCGLLASRDTTKHSEAAQRIRCAVAPWPFDINDKSVII